MGGGLAFLTKKSFNPANWSNQRQVWEARQNHETEKRRIAERESQLKREREEEDLARVVGGEVDGGRKALGFMYDAGKVPGLDRRNNNGDNDNGEESICFGKIGGDEDKQQRGGGDNAASLFERQPGDDDAAAAFRAMLAKPAEEPNLTGSAAAAPLPEGDDGNDNVDGAGNDVAADDDKNESRERDHRTNLEKAVGRGINAQSGVTLAQQFERFPMLKGAPMVLQKSGGGDGKKEEKSAVNVTGLNFKPLGQVLRNVQCLACRKWGHARGDRECEVSGWNPFASVSAVATPVPAAVVKSTLEIAPPMVTESALAEKIVVAEPKLKDRTKDRKDKKRRSRRKEDRHRKRKRRRRERSPSYSSSDSASSSSSYDGDGGYDSRKKSRGHHRRRYDDSDDSGGQGDRPQRYRKESGGRSNHHRSDRRSSPSRHHRKSSSSRRHRRDRRHRSRSRSSSLSK